MWFDLEELPQPMRPTKQADYENWPETDAGRRTWLKLQRTKNSARSSMSHRTPSILCKIARFKQNLQILRQNRYRGHSKPASEQYRPAILVSCAHNGC